MESIIEIADGQIEFDIAGSSAPGIADTAKNEVDIDCIIESILFVSGEPVKLSRIAAVLGIEESEAEAAADRMRDRYAFERRGIQLIKLDGAAQLCSSPDNADYIRLALESRKPPQLTLPALEVLAVIAYFQPVTRAYIERIRGVDSAYTVGLLIDRGLIESCGRLDAPGRPNLYRTTFVFLRTFGLESLDELPALPQIDNSGDENRQSIHNAILELTGKTDSGGLEEESGERREERGEGREESGEFIP